MSVAAVWKTGLILISGDPKVDFQLKMMDSAEDVISDIKVPLAGLKHTSQDPNRVLIRQKLAGKREGRAAKIQMNDLNGILDSLTSSPKMELCWSRL